MTLNGYAFSARDYRADAEQGYADAQYDPGRCYAKGEGVTQDCFEAVKWYRKAAEQGEPDAQSALKEWQREKLRTIFSIRTLCIHTSFVKKSASV